MIWVEALPGHDVSCKECSSRKLEILWQEYAGAVKCIMQICALQVMCTWIISRVGVCGNLLTRTAASSKSHSKVANMQCFSIAWEFNFIQTPTVKIILYRSGMERKHIVHLPLRSCPNPNQPDPRFLICAGTRSRNIYLKHEMVWCWYQKYECLNIRELQ